MESFLFGLNIVLPIFLLIVFGAFLKKKKLLTEDFIRVGTTLVYQCALPLCIFQDVAESDVRSMVNGRFILFIVGVTLFVFGLSWLLSLKLCKDKRKRGVFMQGVFRGNYVYVGLPITQNILGMEVVPCTILVITFVIPLYNILAVIALSMFSQGEQKINMKKMLLDILKNPLILAVLAALPFSLFQWKIPGALNEAMSDMGSIAMPLALLFIGATLRYKEFIQNLAVCLEAAVLKLILIPLAFVTLAMKLHFNSEEVVTIFVMLSVPTALNSYIVAKKMGGDEEAAAGIIMATTVMCVITFPIGIMILKGVGIL